MKLLVNKLHYPVEVLGPGRRAGIWVQGCTIHCFGCISRDTWPADPRFGVDVKDVLGWLSALPADGVDGITISGGEPFDQPDALENLLQGLHEWRAELSSPVDILAYSGRSYDDLATEFPAQLAKLDAVVSEPFVQGAPTLLPLRGSANQRVVALSPLGIERYTGDALDALGAQRHQMQVAVDNESIWMIGIPEQGALRRIQAQASSNGLEVGRASWLV